MKFVVQIAGISYNISQQIVIIKIKKNHNIGGFSRNSLIDNITTPKPLESRSFTRMGWIAMPMAVLLLKLLEVLIVLLYTATNCFEEKWAAYLRINLLIIPPP